MSPDRPRPSLLRPILVVLVLGALFVTQVATPWLEATLEQRVRGQLARVFAAPFTVGELRIDYLPPALYATDFRVRLGEREVLGTDALRVDLRWLDWTLELQRLEVLGGRMVVIRDAAGGYSFDEVLRAELFTGSAGGATIPEVGVRDTEIVYEDPRLGEPLALTGTSLVVDPGDAGGYAARLEASFSAGGRVEIDGTFALRPEVRGRFAWELDGVSAASLARWLRDSSLRVRGDLRAEGDVAGALRHPELTARLRTPRLGVQVGQEDSRRWIRLRDLDATLRAGPDGVWLEDLGVVFAGTMEATREDLLESWRRSLVLAGGQLRASGDLTRGRERLRLSGAGLDLEELLGILDVRDPPVRGVLGFEGEVARGAGALPRVTAAVEAASLGLHLPTTGAPSVMALEEVTGTLELVDRSDAWVVALRGGRADALGGSVAARGHLEVTTSTFLDLRVLLEGGDAARLEELGAGGPVELSGTTRADLRVQLEGGAPVLRGEVGLRDGVVTLVLGETRLPVTVGALGGPLEVTADAVRLGRLEGRWAGGPVRTSLELAHRDPALPWRWSLEAEGADLSVLASQYLTQPHELRGRLDGDLLLRGRGGDRTFLSGAGSLAATATVVHLGSLEEAERRFSLRNLEDIGVRTLRSRVTALAGRLHLQEIALETSHGSARGDLYLGVHEGALDGGFDVSLARRVLGPGHRIASLLEGGRLFDFDLEVGGTLSDPRWTFSAPGLYKGAALTGAVMFSPVGVPLAVVSGLKNLFRRRRRRPSPRAHLSSPPSAGTTGP